MAKKDKVGSRRTALLGGVVGLFLAQGVWHGLMVQPTWAQRYMPPARIGEGLSPDQLLIAVAGFREMIAGILWVRADSFFDQGNYDAILPIIRLVTILDPKQIDVYATGMWHIGYNFTDEESRSDRRYIPSALALGAEGAKNNSDTYELFFETGWIWYHKIDDNYDRAVNWFEQAITKPDMQEARRNLLSMAYQRNGQLDKQADYLKGLLTKAEERLKENPEDFSARQNRDTIEGNYDNHLVRMAQRGVFAQKRGDFAQRKGYDTQPPFDVGFSARVTVVEPRVLRVEGTWNVLPVGTRIRFVLRDANYPNAVPGGMVWDSTSAVSLDPPKNLTFLQDGLFVRDQRFNRTIDMSRDPTMYPFSQNEYTLEFYFNSRSAAAHMQDKFGFNGEGMTDKNFLRDDIREGQRVVFWSTTLTREQIWRRGTWDISDGKTPVVQTPNFRSQVATDLRSDIMKVPGLQTPPRQ